MGRGFSRRFVATVRLRAGYEYLPETSEAVIQAAMTDLMLRRWQPVR